MVRQQLEQARAVHQLQGPAGSLLVGRALEAARRHQDALRRAHGGHRVGQGAGGLDAGQTGAGHRHPRGDHRLAQSGRPGEEIVREGPGFEQALEVFETSGDALGRVRALANLGNACQRLGRYRESAEHYREALDVLPPDGAAGVEADLLTGLGFELPADLGASDLLVAVRAEGEQQLSAALAYAGEALAEASSGGGAPQTSATVPPRTVGSAARSLPAGENWALVSVPGRHAFVEALDAVEAGLNVMVFSDNVPVQLEVRLKQAAAAHGVLVLGPDCGTAIVGGVGLGFANVVRRGPIGVVAASGTGAQQLTCLLDEAGTGISSCLGVGGRDLSTAVGALGARAALKALDADPETESIVVVSKPPDRTVAAALRVFAATLSKPCTFAMLGAGQPDLTTVAEDLTGVAPLDRQWPSAVPVGGGFSTLRGAFVGGSLCDEAMVIAAPALGPIASNIPLAGAPRLDRGLDVAAGVHAMVDFGDDDLTRGRAHPMIDGSLRADWILRQAAAADGGTPGGLVLLLDVVLGHGAAADPAAELAPAISAAHVEALAAGRPLAVVVSLCGTEQDPQGRERQAAALAAAGAEVHLSNAAAARAAVALIAGQA